MRILLVGSGGREHALAWKLAQSARVSDLLVAPGSDAMKTLRIAATGAPVRCANVAATDVDLMCALAESERADLVIVGPEDPLAAGLADRLSAQGVNVFGPSQAAAQLESSKAFAKDFMARHAIPTAAYGRFTSAEPARAFLATMTPPYVIKASGLAAGKGVVITSDLQAAQDEVDAFLDGRHGDASREIVIEEFLDGEEASIFAVVGVNAVADDGWAAMVACQDHKRAHDGDEGPNTGGMGAYAPAPIVTPEIQDQINTTIIGPTIAGMAAEGAPFVGVLYVGVMIGPDGPKVVEYNVRFGDPECQVLMALLTGDLAHTLMQAATEGVRPDVFKMRSQAAVCVVLAARGYPGAVEKGDAIGGLEAAAAHANVEVFHAGTALEDKDTWRANGGRVLGVTARANSLSDAVTSAYEAVDEIKWPGGYCRRDIAWRALARTTETS